MGSYLGKMDKTQKKPKGSRKFDASMIGSPSNFQHLRHQGDTQGLNLINIEDARKLHSLSIIKDDENSQSVSDFSEKGISEDLPPTTITSSLSRDENCDFDAEQSQSDHAPNEADEQGTQEHPPEPASEINIAPNEADEQGTQEHPLEQASQATQVQQENSLSRQPSDIILQNKESSSRPASLIKTEKNDEEILNSHVESDIERPVSVNTGSHSIANSSDIDDVHDFTNDDGDDGDDNIATEKEEDDKEEKEEEEEEREEKK